MPQRTRRRPFTPEDETNTVCLLAGCGQRGCGDGRATSATFNSPSDICWLGDANGTLAVSDAQNNTLRIIAPGKEAKVHSLRSSTFNTPRGLAMMSSSPNKLLVCDAGHHRLQFANLPTTSLLTDMTFQVFAGCGQRGLRDGPAAVAAFNQPSDICVGDDNTIYVSDTGNHCIRQLCRVQGDQWIVSTIAGGMNQVPSKNVRGRLSMHSGYMDGPGSRALFRAPCGLALGSSGELLVADTFNHCIRAVAQSGEKNVWTVHTIAGTGGQSGHLDGACASALFNQPVGLCRTRDGSLFVSDKGNNCIRQIGGYVNPRKYCWVRTIDVGHLAPNWHFPKGIEPPFLLPRGLTELHHAWHTGTCEPSIGKLVVGVCDSGNHIVRVLTIDAPVEVTPEPRQVVSPAARSTKSTCPASPKAAKDVTTHPDIFKELKRLREENERLRRENAVFYQLVEAAADQVEIEELSHG
ncbi:unnamed protein product [Aphanomyces euteiches]|uniref:SMP-30/Gluconolactonase/LRE-like region domain-containing protein n=1 Tax=Aphanomyces euteiches TaxID=100861 RepID=A0A6G0X996_9STRA|nr:hypothetical protein Ae201684_007114 [Aphanomyces euteiches]KAH9151499.1 hypothetical protein AeRB84_005896 [Aphanomyces euteiches]